MIFCDVRLRALVGAAEVMNDVMRMRRSAVCLVLKDVRVRMRAVMLCLDSQVVLFLVVQSTNSLFIAYNLLLFIFNLKEYRNASQSASAAYVAWYDLSGCGGSKGCF